MPDWIGRARLIVTTLVLIGFGALLWYLMVHRNDEEVAWARAVYVLNGVEAVAFTAVGWLFGREVGRAQAESAESRAREAERDRAEAQGRATQAIADGQMISSLLDQAEEQVPRAGTAAGLEDAGRFALPQIAALARERFPRTRSATIHRVEGADR